MCGALFHLPRLFQARYLLKAQADTLTKPVICIPVFPKFVLLFKKTETEVDQGFRNNSHVGSVLVIIMD